MSSYLKKITQSKLNRFLKKVVDKTIVNIFENKKNKNIESESKASSLETETIKTHPWRLCPIGEHWVIEHEMTIPPSTKGPSYQTL